METKEEIEVKSPLRDKIVMVKAVIRRTPYYEEVNKQHDAIPMYTGTKKQFCVPVDPHTNYLVDPLTKEEREWFESGNSGMNIKPGSLSVYKQGKELKECFWAMINFHVDVDKKGLELNLRKPVDYLRWKLLQTCEDEIAPSWDQRFDKGTYIFALCDGDEEMKSRNKKDDNLKEAYILFGRMDSSVDSMYDFLCVNYINDKSAGLKKPVRTVEMDKLKAQVSEVMEKDLGKFISILKGKNYETQVLIAKGLLFGEIMSMNKGTSFKIKCCDFDGTVKDLVEYLDDIRHQIDRVKLKALIDERMKENE